MKATGKAGQDDAKNTNTFFKRIEQLANDHKDARASGKKDPNKPTTDKIDETTEVSWLIGPHAQPVRQAKMVNQIGEENLHTNTRHVTYRFPRS